MTKSLSVAIVALSLVSPGLMAQKSKTKTPEREVVWNRTVLRKSLEDKRDLGGGFEFRAVSYDMDCPEGCFENPFHIGEFWFKSKMLARGMDTGEFSGSPSKRFALFVDPGANRLKLFDGSADKVKDLGADGVSEVWDFTRLASAHEATAKYADRTIKIVLPE